MAAATRSRSSVLPPRPPPGLRPDELPRLPRTEVASLWRLHALPPRRRRRSSSPPAADVVALHPPGTATAVSPLPNATSRTRTRITRPGVVDANPRTSCRSPARKRARRTRREAPADGKTASSGLVDVEVAGVEDRRGAPAPGPPHLPHDVLVMVLRDAVAICPRSAFGCRLVSRGWREAATEPTVQAIVWRRCIGEEVEVDATHEAETEEESGVTHAGAGGGADSSSGLDGGGETGEGGGFRTTDVAEALAQVELDILGGRDRGRLDDGAPVRLCIGRRWWRAAETLLRRCGAVDRNLSPYDMPDTYEDEVLDAAVDAGETSLCLALLRCPQTAVGIDGWPHHAPASHYVNKFEGPPENQLAVFHAAEALRAGRYELASALVRPRDEGGGGQIPTIFLRTICSGVIPWTEGMRPVLEAVERGMIGRRRVAHEMYKRPHERGRAPWDGRRRKLDRYERRTAEFIHEGLKIEVLICTQFLQIVERHEGTDELQAMLDRLKPIMNKPLEQSLDDV